ncbi:NAD(P)H-dependent flavin oxidoreductase [Rubrobacter aplysinae]|uniref:NAD(P)H-dependent flavin oxidoreductase n=1 Tax=Rubrobacter aplysinae TaxID=909625 RepID=UPI00064BEFDA|nr:nitronate monooxygenase [Rubrobacter aplysinae]
MSLENRLTRLFGIRHPLVQAGMAGGATTPRLVAAVSEAGGLGTLGAGYLQPRAIREAVQEVRILTRAPFAVNLFVPEAFEEPVSREAADALLAPYRGELSIDEPEVSSYAPDFEEQLAVVIEERVPVFSFTFGVPSDERLAALREAGVVTCGTATTVREAAELERRGVDSVCAQGYEAGGHRGTFTGDALEAMVGTFALVPQVADSMETPVIAAGGVMDGRGLAAALALGADGAQMGTAFLTSAESGAHPAYKRALLAATDEDTTVTRAFSGKPARGLRNRFTREMAPHEAGLPDYPVQNAYTRDLRAAAASRGDPDLMSLWAGQASGMSRELPAAEIVERTVEQALRARGGPREG